MIMQGTAARVAEKRRSPQRGQCEIRQRLRQISPVVEIGDPAQIAGALPCA